MNTTNDEANDPINPSHYKDIYPVEIINITECMNFNRGNAVKYVSRAGYKNKATEIEDLTKAIWYLQREIQRISK